MPLAPASVTSRLARLYLLARVERDEEARARLARERPVRVAGWERAVASRLGELRALVELTAYLHRRRGS